MLEIMSSYAERIVNLLGTLGYSGIFFLSFLDRLTVFIIPAEIVLPSFGILISQGKFIFWPVFVWVTIGSFLGNLALYLIFLNRGRLFLEKYGRYFLISKHELGHLDRWFLKYGDKFVLIAYLVPTSVRSLVPILAGISKMNFLRFSLYTFLSSLPLNFVYIYAGIKAGDNFNKIFGYFAKFNYVVIAIIIVLVIWYVYRHIKGRHLTHK